MWSPAVAMACLLALVESAAAFTPLDHADYSALLNPSRGRINQQSVFLSKPETELKVESVTPWDNRALSQTTIYLDTRADGSALSDAEISMLDKSLAAFSSAGVKTVVRFAYHTDNVIGTSEPMEPKPDGIARHVGQLAPLFETYKDAILMIQHGFIGAWGEQHFTTHYGGDIVSPDEWVGRNQVAEAILNGTPETTWASMRTPRIKQAFVGNTTVVKSDTAFGTNKEARIGHHNDCLFGSPNDLNSYRENDWDGPDHVYVREESLYVPRGGEVCGTSDPAGLYTCERALRALSEESWSYLNIWNKSMEKEWKASGCFDEIVGRLGYRYELGSSESSGSITLSNTGWSRVWQEYTVGVLLVPQGASPTAEGVQGFWGDAGVDLRDVGAGENITIPFSFCPSAEGKYDAFLTITDNLSPETPSYRILLSHEETNAGPEWAKTARISALGEAKIGGDKCLPVEARTVKLDNNRLVWDK